MTAKFTPGPWKIGNEGIGPVSKEEDQSYGMLLPVAYIEVVDWPENHEANAHLIAAAPDLYEALKAVLEIETEEGAPSAPSHTSSGKSGSIAWSVKAREVYSNAHAALARARGEV